MSGGNSSYLLEFFIFLSINAQLTLHHKCPLPTIF
nr:MAG TPA: hypothetical protein [Microviridae sp.]